MGFRGAKIKGFPQFICHLLTLTDRAFTAWKWTPAADLSRPEKRAPRGALFLHFGLIFQGMYGILRKKTIQCMKKLHHIISICFLLYLSKR